MEELLKEKMVPVQKQEELSPIDVHEQAEALSSGKKKEKDSPSLKLKNVMWTPIPHSRITGNKNQSSSYFNDLYFLMRCIYL